MIQPLIRPNEKFIYLLQFLNVYMKELDIYIVPEDLQKISEIFDKHNVVARAYHDVQGSGPSERKEVQEMVHTRMTGRKFQNLKKELTSMHSCLTRLQKKLLRKF